jgi:EthD domain
MAYKMLYLARRAATVSWEQWPRAWKSHAIFASQFPAMSGTIDWMRYTTRVDDPKLGNLPVSTEHDGVSVAQAPELGTFHGRGFSPEQRALIDKDELRVFDRYTPEFSFYCTEARVLDGALGEAAVFRFLHRKADVSRDAFEEHLKGEHARLCAQASDTLGALRWALNITIEAPPPEFPFEAIDECWFANVDHAVRALTAPAMAQLTEDLGKVCKAGRNITMLTRPTHRWPNPPKKNESLSVDR